MIKILYFFYKRNNNELNILETGIIILKIPPIILKKMIYIKLD